MHISFTGTPVTLPQVGIVNKKANAVYTNKTSVTPLIVRAFFLAMSLIPFNIPYIKTSKIHI